MNPPNPPSGTGPMAAWCRKMLNYVESLRIRPGRGYNLIPSPRGVAFDFPAPGIGGPPAGGAGRYRIKGGTDDHLSCVTWDGTTEGTETIFIAKPDELRCSNAGPEVKLVSSYTYTYSAGPDDLNKYRVSKVAGLPDENQLVTPPWFIDAVIYAIKADPGVKDPNGKPISLLVDSPARLWCKV